MISTIIMWMFALLTLVGVAFKLNEIRTILTQIVDWILRGTPRHNIALRLVMVMGIAASTGILMESVMHHVSGKATFVDGWVQPLLSIDGHTNRSAFR